MTTKHTPGPWYTTAKGNKYQAQIAQEPTGKTISVTYTGNDADARLIAAAPDLLAALEALVSIIYSEQPNPSVSLRALIPQARAAIAKAKGGK